ncbi:MAG: flagellar export protein FliJ [Nitrospiraceae bacterium]
MNLKIMRNYRSQLETMLRAELVELERALETAIRKRRTLMDRADADLRQFFGTGQGPLGADETALRYTVWEQLGEAIRHFDEMIVHARTRRDVKQAEMVEAAREAKKLDILVQRQARRLRLEELRQDQRALDEAASRRHGCPAQ